MQTRLKLPQRAVNVRVSIQVHSGVTDVDSHVTGTPQAGSRD